MYYEKIDDILVDLEEKDVPLAGGSTIGIVLSVTNSLVKYIANLTIGKKKYISVENDVIKISKNAETLKQRAKSVIDKDVEVLDNLLLAYKNRKGSEKDYENSCKKATEFSLEVAELSIDTLNVVDEIFKIGNKMLKSDFEICVYYAYAALEASIVNIKVNLNSVDDTNFKNSIEEKYKKMTKDANTLKENILKEICK